MGFHSVIASTKCVAPHAMMNVPKASTIQLKGIVERG